MAKVHIVYGSGGGNTEIICERVAELLRGEGHEVMLFRAKLTRPAEVMAGEVVILGCPTYGHGQLEKYFEVFLQELAREELAGRRFAVVALGDPKYDCDYHLESARVLTHFLREKKAEIIYRPLMISKSPVPYLAELVPKWVEGLCKGLK